MVTDCAHDTAAVREKRDSLGRALFALQCDACGDRSGPWLPHTDCRALNAPPWIQPAAPPQRAQLTFGQPAEGTADVVRTMRLASAEFKAYERVAQVAREVIDGTAPLLDLTHALVALDEATLARKAA